MVNREGTVVGEIEAVVVNLNSAALGDHRGNDREREEVKTEPPSPLPSGQQRMLADPVEDVFNHYRTALERPKAQLQPKVRRWISDAIEAVGIERCKRAIDGLAASEHHRQGGYVGIEYALRPKVGQTIEGRVAMMEAKAPNSSNGQTTVADLLASVPSGGHDIVRTRMENVRRMYESPDHEGTRRLGQESARQLREAVPHIEPVIEQCRIVGWRRVEA